ncbi:MAG: hypothetical protein CL505_05385 [Actinobacteria bacterium]|nr:hypothetical protein [Actinomycetota bacterium]
MASVLLLVGVAAACGGAVTPLPAPVDGMLRVVALDTLDFGSDQYGAEAGEITIQYVLDGMQGHSLVVEDHEDRLRLEVSGGSTAVGTIDLDAGRYILYCDIPGHREGGMEARLLVG